jgi:hypothetical protein
MKANIFLTATMTMLLVSAAQASAAGIPSSFESRDPDRAAIETLLATYTKAVSEKDQRLFETLLLDKNIPFSGVGAASNSAVTLGSIENYDGFRKGVFEGPAFKQTFQDIHIAQDGNLAQVSLVFKNTSADGSSWGWKTMQLLKVDGQWKIASEFYTGHRL